MSQDRLERLLSENAMDESDGTSIEYRCSPSREGSLLRPGVLESISYAMSKLSGSAEIEFKVGQPNSEQQKWAQMHLLAKRESESQSNNIT